MTDYDKLAKLCNKILDESNSLPSSYEECKSRLDLELSEIKKKEEAWMFLRFYKAVKNGKIEKIEKNEHNLFMWWLLGVCPSFEMKKSPAYTEADIPDVDVDYHPVIRESLKDDFSFRRYGKDYVSNIVSYQTYGIKSSLIDMARVLGEDRNEILSITTQLEKMKNDEGEDSTFESLEEDFNRIEQKISEKKTLTKFEQIMVRLNDYRKAHLNVWEAAKNLVAAQIDWGKFEFKKPPHRKKSMSMHASGLIISGKKISEFVPLVVPPGSRNQGLQATAWVEGLADTDCSSVGLVKFDYLSLEANAKIAECNRLIMERHGLDSICALPGLSNWSDTSYLNDPKSLEMANAGDLKGIFQFDSGGIRKLAKKGGVTSFDDLVAYSALYRPGTMNEGMHDEYCDRKNGKKDYEIHPLLVPILKSTYGILCYQEQIMRVLNIVGNIPLKDCEAVRKAISKKKVEKFAKYEEIFITNGKKNLSESEEYIKKMWAQIVAFAGYGFNLSHAVAYTYVSARQLWQKAHYPLEFYASALKSLKTGDARIMTYIQDARKKKIPVNPLHLNKSKFDFDIVDNEIYYGFNKIKGIGHDVATRIVELQPYTGIQDFLDRFGTEAKVIQPLICLRVFTERDPHTLYLYCETYKKALKAERDRGQRNKNSVSRYTDQLAELIGPDRIWEHGFDDNYFGELRTLLDDKAWIKLCTIKKKYDNCVDTFVKKSKNKEDISLVLSVDSFVPPSPNNKTLVLSKPAYKAYKAIKPILKDPEGIEAEIAYYGFPWKNDFEQTSNYKGFTFDDYEIDILRVEEGSALPVEVKIMQKEHTVSRSGKMWYWKLRVCDALESDNLRTITVWEHDYERFESALQVGNIVRLRLLPPEPPYPNYSLEGVKPWEMRGRNPYGEDPRWDFRVVLLSKGAQRKKFIDDEDDNYILSPGRKKKSQEDSDLDGYENGD